jgi:hypothetical protein
MAIKVLIIYNRDMTTSEFGSMVNTRYYWLGKSSVETEGMIWKTTIVRLDSKPKKQKYDRIYYDIETVDPKDDKFSNHIFHSIAQGAIQIFPLELNKLDRKKLKTNIPLQIKKLK